MTESDDLIRTAWGSMSNLAPRRDPRWCAQCLYPEDRHVGGQCEDFTGNVDDESTFVSLDLGTFTPSRDVADSWGECAYLFWIEDCFDPLVYFCRGDNFGDAYEWFLDDLATRGVLTDCHEDLIWEAIADPDGDAAAYVRSEGAEIPAGYENIDGHSGIFYTENINGRWVGGAPDRG